MSQQEAIPHDEDNVTSPENPSQTQQEADTRLQPNVIGFTEMPIEDRLGAVRRQLGSDEPRRTGIRTLRLSDTPEVPTEKETR